MSSRLGILAASLVIAAAGASGARADEAHDHEQGPKLFVPADGATSDHAAHAGAGRDEHGAGASAKPVPSEEHAERGHEEHGAGAFANPVERDEHDVRGHADDGAQHDGATHAAPTAGSGPPRQAVLGGFAALNLLILLAAAFTRRRVDGVGRRSHAAAAAARSARA